MQRYSFLKFVLPVFYVARKNAVLAEILKQCSPEQAVFSVYQQRNPNKCFNEVTML